MAQAVSRRPLPTEVRVRAQVRPYTTVVDKVALGHVLSKFFGFLLSISLHRGSILIYNLGDEQYALGGRSSGT
jgi:hypothetical protein